MNQTARVITVASDDYAGVLADELVAQGYEVMDGASLSIGGVHIGLALARFDHTGIGTDFVIISVIPDGSEA